MTVHLLSKREGLPLRCSSPVVVAELRAAGTLEGARPRGWLESSWCVEGFFPNCAVHRSVFFGVCVFLECGEASLLRETWRDV